MVPFIGIPYLFTQIHGIVTLLGIRTLAFTPNVFRGAELGVRRRHVQLALRTLDLAAPEGGDQRRARVVLRFGLMVARSPVSFILTRTHLWPL